MYKSFDRHLNVFWNYNGSPKWENNITKAFINTISYMKQEKQIELINNLLGSEIKDNNISIRFELQSINMDLTKNECDKYLLTLNPSGETWGNETENKLHKINFNEISFDLNKANDEILANFLVEKNIIDKDQKDNYDILNAFRETLINRTKRGGSIPDGWILIFMDEKLEIAVALETKLWDLDPYQIDNHLEKSLGISKKSNDKIRHITFNTLCKNLIDIYKGESRPQIASDFLNYMDWLDYFDHFNKFSYKDIKIHLHNDGELGYLKKKWNRFFKYYFNSIEYQYLVDELNIEKHNSAKKRIWFDEIKGQNIYYDINFSEENIMKRSGIFIGSEIGVKNKNTMKKILSKIDKDDIEKLEDIYSFNCSKKKFKIYKRLNCKKYSEYFNYFESNNIKEAINKLKGEKVFKNKLDKNDTIKELRKIKSQSNLDEKSHIEQKLKDVKRYKWGEVKENGEIISFYNVLSYLRIILYFDYNFIVDKNKYKLNNIFSSAITQHYIGLKELNKIAYVK